MPEIDILIKAIDQASPAVKAVDSGLKTMGTTAHDTSGKMSGLQTVSSGLGNVLKAGLTTALVGVGAAFGGLIFAFKDSLSAAKESIDAHKQLVAVLTSTGQAAGVTASMAIDLANSLSQVTNFSDDAIVSGENLLLTFTGIGKDVFPAATQTMLDMSQALGQDMKSSAVQLGKALNDPINGITALSRVGVSFTDQQKEMIKTMQDAGDVAGAQKIILDELAKEFGGSAKAMADPFVQLQNQWGEVQEAVGKGLIPVLNDLARNALPYVQAAAQAVSTGFQTFYDALDDGATPLQALGQAIRDALPPDLQQKWDDITSSIQGSINTITGTVQNGMGMIRLAWDLNLDGMRSSTLAFSAHQQSDFDELLKTLNEIISNGSVTVKFNWTDMFIAMLLVSQAKSNEILDVAVLFFKLVRDAQKTFSSLFTGDWQGFWDGVKLIMNTVTNAMLDDTEKRWGPAMRNGFVTAFTMAWDGMKEVWSNIVAWWNSTVAPFFGVTGLVPTMPQLPNLVPAPPPTGQDNLSGKSPTANVSSLGGVNVTQHFYGQTDPTTVHDAAGTGVLAAARSMGLG